MTSLPPLANLLAIRDDDPLAQAAADESDALRLKCR